MVSPLAGCINPCLPSPNCEPQLSLRRPALEDLLLGSNANLTCTLSGLKKPEGATFTWNPSGGKDPIQGTPQRDSCGCYSVSSVLPGCAEPWNRGETFSCTATHPDSESSLTATITKPSGGLDPSCEAPPAWGPHSVGSTCLTCLPSSP